MRIEGSSGSRPALSTSAAHGSWKMSLVPALCLILLCSTVVNAQEEKTMSIAEAAEQAITLGQITIPGSTPFHLKAQIADAHDPAKYKAEVEEYWVSPEKWRRTIHSPDFSQTLIVTGDKLSEQDTGDYYPFWLRDLVTAMFDPLPMRQQLMRVKGEFTLPM